MEFSGRPRLAPGLRVVRRGLQHLQVGLYDGRRALLPRTAAVEGTLAALLEHQPVEPGPGSEDVLETLWRHGCLADAAVENDRDRRRRAARVAVRGGVGPERALLTGAGVRVVDPDRAADVVLVGVHGELERDRLDALVRHGTAHLVVRLVDGAAVIGPFVVPGRTACLRCLDAHDLARDPDHAAVTQRYVRATARPRADGAPDVGDRALPALAAAWAVRDVVAHLEGRRPASWSRTLTLGPDPAPPREQVWPTHPDCGCSWTAYAPWSGTMGA